MALKTKVGLLFLVAALLLAGLTFMVEDLGETFTKGYTLQVKLKEADVEEGSPVRLAGVKVGKVKTLQVLTKKQLDKGDDRPVLVTMRIQAGTEVYDTFLAKVVASGLLGKSVLSIEMMYTPLSRLLKDGDMMPHSAETVSIESVLKEAKEAAENINVATAKLRAGEGTVGKLIMTEELYDDLKGGVKSFRATFENASTITATINRGEGTIGRLVNSEDMGARVDSAVTEFRETFANANDLVRGVKDGRGTVGKLMRDEQMAQDAKDTVANAKKAFAGIDSVTADIKAGKGTLGRLANDENLAENVDATIEGFKRTGKNLGDITDEVKKGEGTVGKLIYDDKLINTAQEVLDSVQTALEDLRESAPVASFAGAILGAF